MALLFKITLALLGAGAVVWVLFWLGVALLYLVVTIVECIAKLLR